MIVKSLKVLGLHSYIVLFLHAITILPVLAEDNLFDGGLISPQPGVICNETPKVCYDELGVSIGITKDVMGDQAAANLAREHSGIDESSFDRSNFNPVEGISCHTLEKACYKGDTLYDALSVALFGDAVGEYGPESLVNVPWSWDRSNYNNDTEVLAADGRTYQVIFLTDSVLQIQADCNKIFGQYSAQDSSLSITLGPGTLMVCGADSQDQQFLKDLEGTASWLLKKGELYLDIKYDTGTVVFYRGVTP